MTRTRRPRRKRFVVGYVKNGEHKTIDVVSHTEEAAIETAERHGYATTSARPYVKGERVKLPTDGGWSLIENAFYDACAELGIEFQVSIQKTGHKGARMGRHRADSLANGTPYHNITIKSWLTAEQAGRTLWHELRHAQQCEALAARIGHTFGTQEFIRAMRAEYRDGTTYAAKRWEIEANATEPNNDRLPLARRSYV